jgi:hypothetical protein
MERLSQGGLQIEMATVTKGSETTARRRIRNAVKEAAASMWETNGASHNGAADSGLDIARIRLRAYEMFLARGATHGDDLADWFSAERELLGARNP